MAHIIQDFSTIKDKLKTLGYQIPVAFTFLPENINKAENQAEFVYSDSLVNLKKIFKENNIVVSEISTQNTQYRLRKSDDWIVPTLFVGISLMSQNGIAVSIALNVLSNYLTDFFKGKLRKPKVKFDIVVETKKGIEYKKISYEGDSEGIKDLDKIIKSLTK